jgi:hypothetical protein
MTMNGGAAREMQVKFLANCRELIAMFQGGGGGDETTKTDKTKELSKGVQTASI